MRMLSYDLEAVPAATAYAKTNYTIIKFPNYTIFLSAP